MTNPYDACGYRLNDFSSFKVPPTGMTTRYAQHSMSTSFV